MKTITEAGILHHSNLYTWCSYLQ